MDNLSTEQIQNNLANAEEELARLRPEHDAAACNYAQATQLRSYAGQAAPNHERVRHLEGAIYCMRQELEKRHGVRMPNMATPDDIKSYAMRNGVQLGRRDHPVNWREVNPRST